MFQGAILKYSPGYVQILVKIMALQGPIGFKTLSQDGVEICDGKVVASLELTFQLSQVPSKRSPSLHAFPYHLRLYAKAREQTEKTTHDATLNKVLPVSPIPSPNCISGIRASCRDVPSLRQFLRFESEG